MNRYYSPTIKTEVFENIDDITGATRFQDMPADSQRFFDGGFVIPEGKTWGNDSTGRFPVLVDRPAPTQSEQEAAERAWAQNQLRRTDFIILPDSPYTEPHRQLVRTYRAALRNPTRTTHATFPAQTWRPTFPAGVKEPD